MKQWTIGLAVAIASGFANLAHATSVTWSFYETGISCLSGSCFLPPQPYVLAMLVLPGPTSTGTARWRGSPGPAPVYTGDEFTLDLPFTKAVQLSPAFTGPPPGTLTECFLVCAFDIKWSATPSGLDIALNLHAIHDTIGANAGGGPFGGALGPFGGAIASDFQYGGCINTQCLVTGFWLSDLPVPEPMSIVLLLTGLFGTRLVRGNQRLRRPAAI